ncbi:MAG: single-stranded-DNA-specific exonuclease RecJ [Ahrensia sp.]|nr:single-stranded-DNA-specific exonuclease RecJ [Ahrensia sp.]
MEPAERAFLNVRRSVLGRRWSDRLGRAEAGQAEKMAQAYRIAELLARILAARGVQADDAVSFLNPTLRDLMPDPATLTDMDAAAARIASAITDREHVAIFGDYDVDGATSSALLAKYLRAFGLTASIHIPDRIFEGYGPNVSAVESLIDDGARLLITVDCGSGSFEPFEAASARGVDVIVLDHHQVGDELPAIQALVNPNRHDDLSGQGHLSAVGVVFLALVAVNRKLRDGGQGGQDSLQLPDLMEWLDLVALGTVCDVVPLTGLNRAYATRGLDVMRNQANPGLAALSKAARLAGPVEAWHLGFLLGPRINAGGRIGDAALGARLLTTHDPVEAEQIALQLDTLNAERQAMEADMLEQAIAEAEAERGGGDGPAVIVTQSDTWHVGVVGLLASRLKDRFRRPAFAIQFDDRGVGVGSGRSIPGVDLGKAVRTALERGLLQKGGGHAMAAGITIERSKLGAFRAFLEESAGPAFNATRTQDVLLIDGALSARGATTDLFDDLQRAGPFGSGNPQPVFAFPRHRIANSSRVGRDHVRFQLKASDGASLDGISFRSADTGLGRFLLQNDDQPAHFVGTLSADFFRGRRRIQLRLLDASAVADISQP